MITTFLMVIGAYIVINLTIVLWLRSQGANAGWSEALLRQCNKEHVKNESA